MYLVKSLVVIMFLLVSSLSCRAFVTVGSDPTCTYGNLFDAYLDADINIRVTSQQVHSLLFAISKSKFFKGGYDDCAQAELDNVGENKSKWSGLNSATVLYINANLATQSLISFSNFEFYDGQNISAGSAGGVLIFSKSTVAFVNSTIHHNAGSDGGGVRVTGQNAQLILNNSKISLNTATNNGGGIHCSNSASVTIFGNSAINSNQAETNGGGIYASNCTINDSSGDINSGFGAQKGIYANIAKFGGGVYLSNSAIMNLTGNDEHPASIDLNFSTNGNEQLLGGGGIYMTGNGTQFNGINAKIINNNANTGGAGFVLKDSSQLTMKRLNSTCWDNNKCSELSNNNVLFVGGFAGAGYISENSTVNIAQTFIDNNKARSEALFKISQSTLVLEGNLISNHKAEAIPLVANSLISLQKNSRLDFHYNTLTNNTSFKIFELKLKTQQQLNVYNSIIWDSGQVYSELDNSGASLPLSQEVTFNCSYLHEIDSMTPNVSSTHTFISNPHFADAINGDYHLANDSFALDLCNENTIQSQFLDLNGKPRGIDLISFPDFVGVFDAGAYELQSTILDEEIFNNSFE